MNLKNFTISSDNVSFEKGSDLYDLKNCYDFVGVDYKAINKTAILEWKKIFKAKLSAKSSPYNIYLIIEDVYLFTIKEFEALKSNTEEDNLKSISFLWHGLFEELGVCVSHKPEEEKTHLSIEFENGLMIKIGAKSVILKTMKNQILPHIKKTG